MNLTKNVKMTKIENATAAGTSTPITSTTIDMAGFEGCMFVVSFGAIEASAATSVEVHTSTVTGSGFTALLGTGVTVADDDDDGLVWIDIHKPLERFLRLIINRATQNSTIDMVLALQYGPKTGPTTHDATTVAGGEFHVSPIRGTA